MNLKKFFSTKSTPIDSTTFNRPPNREFSMTVDVIGKLTECADKHDIPYDKKVIDISEIAEAIEPALQKSLSKYMKQFKNKDDYDLKNMSLGQLLHHNLSTQEFEEYRKYFRMHQVEDGEYYEENYELLGARDLFERHQWKVNQQEVYHRADLMADRVPQY